METKLTPVQKIVKDRIDQMGLNMKEVSLALKKNHAYISQFIDRGIPRSLPEDVRESLAAILKVPADALRDKPKPIRRIEPPKLAVVTGGRGEDHNDAGAETGEASMVFVPERDARATAGPGGLVDGNHYHDAPEVVAKHGFPAEGFRQVYGAPANVAQMIMVIGDSMRPTLQPGQRVMVDISDKVPSPPGVFIIWDGLGLVLKRVEYIPHSDPPTVRIMSDNPAYAAYERTLDEAHIQGRVIGAWGRF